MTARFWFEILEVGEIPIFVCEAGDIVLTEEGWKGQLRQGRKYAANLFMVSRDGLMAFLEKAVVTSGKNDFIISFSPDLGLVSMIHRSGLTGLETCHAELNDETMVNLGKWELAYRVMES